MLKNNCIKKLPTSKASFITAMLKPVDITRIYTFSTNKKKLKL